MVYYWNIYRGCSTEYLHNQTLLRLHHPICQKLSFNIISMKLRKKKDKTNLLPAAWLLRPEPVLWTPGPADEELVAAEEEELVVVAVEEEEEEVEVVVVVTPPSRTPSWLVIEETIFWMSSGGGADPPEN